MTCYWIVSYQKVTKILCTRNNMNMNMMANVSDVNIFLKILWNFQRWFCDHAFCETPFCGVNNWIDTYFLTSHVTIWIRYCLAFDDQTLQLEVYEWYVINIQVASTYKDVLLYYRSTIHCTRYSPWQTGFDWVRANVHIIGFVTVSSFFLPTSARNNKRWDYWIRDLNLIGIRFLTAEKVKKKKRSGEKWSSLEVGRTVLGLKE